MFLVVAVIVAITRDIINLAAMNSKTVLWGIYTICFAQACNGLFQFVGWLPSNHSKFAITGSFDNPAGFAAVLAIGFPIGLYLLVKAKKVEQYIASTGLILTLITVFLSGSRTGLLAILVSSFIYCLLQINIISKFQKLKLYKLLSAIVMSLLVAGASMLYFQKKDSANGRLLIWEISTKMIKDKPIFGYGFGSFQERYMDYQAEYFKNNPNSKYSQLADNVKHPFNEFIKVTIEFGLIGLAIILSFILFAFWKITKSKNGDRGLVLSGLVSFLVFACFSYPLRYISVWLLLAFYLSALLPTKEIKIRNTPISVITRSIIIGTCVFSLSFFVKQIQAEIHWKTIAVNSLRGNTHEMLPEYEKLYSKSLIRNPLFLYNYGAELNVAGKFDKSINVLNECKRRFNDYDLQMLLADNYYKNGEHGKAIQIYEHASNMVPCRFLPLFQIFKIYKENGQRKDALQYALKIKNKKVKIPSLTISSIKGKAEEYLKENEITFGNTCYI
jgi:O-antigen ligase